LAAATGRTHDKDFHNTFQTTPDASNCFTSVGAPLPNDPYAELGKYATAVLAAAVLKHELSMLPEKRKQCTRFLRLAAQGDVDAARTSTLWNSLPTHLHEEATRSMLGRAGLTSKELSMILHCEGAKLIKNVMTYAGSDDCPFCHQGRESRFHWRHECTQSENGFLQLYQAVSKDLATAGPEFWFDLLRRVDPASGSAARPPSWWANSGVRTELPYSTSLT